LKLALIGWNRSTRRKRQFLRLQQYLTSNLTRFISAKTPGRWRRIVCSMFLRYWVCLSNSLACLHSNTNYHLQSGTWKTSKTLFTMRIQKLPVGLVSTSYSFIVGNIYAISTNPPRLLMVLSPTLLMPPTPRPLKELLSTCQLRNQ